MGHVSQHAYSAWQVCCVMLLRVCVEQQFKTAARSKDTHTLNGQLCCAGPFENPVSLTITFPLSCCLTEGEDGASDTIRSFLTQQQQPEAFIEQVVSIVDCVGFKDELGAPPRSLSIEAAVVQDADRYCLGWATLHTLP
jgi:hypothetical protein